MKKELKTELNQKAVNRKLSCADARKIAERLGVSYTTVGAVTDEHCELGCF